MPEQTRFLALLDELHDIHVRKNRDYGGDDDRLKNLRACTRLGIPAAHGTAVRLGDKWARIEELIRRRYTTGDGPSVTDESLVDTLKDMAVYSLLLIELLEAEGAARLGHATHTTIDSETHP